jgi:hypothetical protein
MVRAVETIYRLSIAGTRECYIGCTTLPLHKRLALHMLDEGGKARWQWMQHAREAGQTFTIDVLEQVAAGTGYLAEERRLSCT